MYEKMKLYWQSEKKNIIFCFVSTFILGLAAHAYVMLNNNMSHDWLNAFVATDIEEEWKIRLGRYIVPLYRNIFRNSIALPWLIGIISLLWYSASSYLITKTFDVQSRIVMFLISGVVVTNITVTAQCATYLYEADFNAFALLLAVAAAYIWKKHTKIYHLMPSAILLFISMGIYQSYVCVTVALILAVSIFDLFDEKNIKTVILKGILGVCIIIIGYVIYYVVGLAVYTVTGLESESRVNAVDFLKSGNNLFSVLADTFVFFARNLFHIAYEKWLMLVIFALTSIVTLSTVIYIFVKRKYGIVRIALIVLLSALFPLGMCAINIIAVDTWTHDLMTYAIWITWIIILVLICKLIKDNFILPYKAIIKSIIFASVFVIIWQNIIISNTVYIRKDLIFKSSFSTMTRVLDRIEQYPGYIEEQTPVAFIGVPEKNDGSSPQDAVNDFFSTGFILKANMNCVFINDTYTDVYNAYKAYFMYIFNSSIVFCDNDTHLKMKENEQVVNMPVFPAKDSVRMIDGIIVVKLG